MLHICCAYSFYLWANFVHRPRSLCHQSQAVNKYLKWVLFSFARRSHSNWHQPLRILMATTTEQPSSGIIKVRRWAKCQVDLILLKHWQVYLNKFQIFKLTVLYEYLTFSRSPSTWICKHRSSLEVKADNSNCNYLN